jgi:hypothetical protein
MALTICWGVSPPRGPPSSPPASELDDPLLDPPPEPEELDEPDELPLPEELLPEELLPEELLPDPEELDEIPAPDELLPPASVVCAVPPEEPHPIAHRETPINPHHRTDRMVSSGCSARAVPFWRERTDGGAGRTATVRLGAPQAAAPAAARVRQGAPLLRHTCFSGTVAGSRRLQPACMTVFVAMNCAGPAFDATA